MFTTCGLVPQSRPRKLRDVLTLHLRKFGRIFFLKSTLFLLFHFFLYMVMLAYLIPDPESHLEAFHLFTSFNNNNGPFLRLYRPGFLPASFYLRHTYDGFKVLGITKLQRVMRVSLRAHALSQTICGQAFEPVVILTPEPEFDYPLLHQSVPRAHLFLSTVRIPLLSASRGFGTPRNQSRKVRQ